MLEKLKLFVEHPYVNLGVGLILLITSLAEAWDSLADDLINLRLKAHHGVMVFAIFSILRVLPELHLGMEHVHRATGKQGDDGKE